MFKKILPMFFVIIFSITAIWPFFLSGFFPMHDDTQVARVFEMRQALLDGQFPVRWVGDLGYHYGYPIFNFYAPFAYYLGALFTFVGFDVLSATKIMMALGVVMAGVFMYLFAKEFWGKAGGIISALLYVYAPYHALNIFVRGAVAEFWAYAFVPLAFFGIYKSAMSQQQDRIRWGIVGALGYAGIIVSHNLTAMMVTPFLLVFLFLLFFQKKTHRPYIIFVSFVLGLLLSAFYWLPVFSEMSYTNVSSQIGGGSNYKDHFVCPIQLWDSQWGFGGSTPTCIDGLSFMVGKMHLLFLVIGVAALLVFRKNRRMGIYFILAVGGSIFLMLKPSQVIWDSFSQMAYFQFPWRFLLMTSFFVSLIGGACIVFLRRFQRIRVLFYGGFGAVVGIIILFNQEVFVPQQYLPRTAVDYTSSYVLWWTTSKISDEYLPKNFQKPKNFQEVPQEKISSQKGLSVDSQTENTMQIRANVTTQEPMDVLIRLAYFPGWQITVDGKKKDFVIKQNGLLIAVPKGAHTIEAKLSQTPVELFANVLSVTGVLLLILGIIRKQSVKSHGKKNT